MPRPIHFEIPAENPERSMGFYSNVFGWKFTKWDGPSEYWTISTGTAPEPGIDGGLLRRRDPKQPCANTVCVTNLEDTLKTVEANGGHCILPKMPIPGIGWLAYCNDLDGHCFGIMQPDANAR